MFWQQIIPRIDERVNGSENCANQAVSSMVNSTRAHQIEEHVVLDVHVVCKRHLATRVYELTKYLRLREADDANTSERTYAATSYDRPFFKYVFHVNRTVC